MPNGEGYADYTADAAIEKVYREQIMMQRRKKDGNKGCTKTKKRAKTRQHSARHK